MELAPKICPYLYCAICRFNCDIWIHCLLLLPDHCMVNFIKNNLLGSLREFRNRFVNPIQNGQCADSTSKDVRLMKKRAHVLHAMLAGCVQVGKEGERHTGSVL